MMVDIIIGIICFIAVIMVCVAMVCATLALIKVTKDYLEV